MKKKEKNEEIQSRREFFKQAAKKALPILGVVVLASIPIVTKATETKTTDCNNTCSGSCTGACSGCSGYCTGGCAGDCTGSCSDACTGCTGCSGSCMSTCTSSSN